jgi:hypothetical protein
MDRRTMLKVGAAVLPVTLTGFIWPAEGQAVQRWMSEYDPQTLVSVALDELDQVLKATPQPPLRVTDSTPVPTRQDTSRMARDARLSARRLDVGSIIEVEGKRYKLEWMESRHTLSGPVHLADLREIHFRRNLVLWQEMFAEQSGPMIVTRRPARETPPTAKRFAAGHKHDLFMRAAVHAEGENLVISLDALVGQMV